MKSRSSQSARPVSGPRQVRIIGGQWKRTPLPVLDAEGLRPTPDRVRETVFNWINHLIDGQWSSQRCLDLFAGTGALGFEAASRGAASVTMVEQSLPAIRQLQANQAKLKADRVAIVRGDALANARAMQARGERFDLVFLDPPYHQDWLVKILPLCASLLSPAGMVYAEAEMPLEPGSGAGWLQDWEVLRSDRAGMVWYHLLRRNSPAQIQA
ncbi:16S rRNA (guanine(966)-N(2))-methyltransferase RsmD [Noviherbaspirillum aridicola]|uniref:Methyltransferase n=1 Tax=Noviherbaspirillum aridicola TaxID=2849687 RepID=A0ABQ4Q281_9BURK|nr:16S rRNA (guanine(966)-N(2))-methyltransferase RsmD [Noviherbaspirillum aridicola]GIZ50854.1 methyltransferase [Noviherbaspirillum aridicola]